jgi:phage terminase large subunit-like protein
MRKQSLAEQLAALPHDKRMGIIDKLSEEEHELLLYEWGFWARPSQIAPPGDWQTWLVMAGRGFGKTRIGAEFVREKAKKYARGALIGATGADVRDVMILGESGISNITPPDEKPEYKANQRKLVFPNGAEVYLYSALEPDRLRGPQHEYAWCDEIAAWRYSEEAWDNLLMGLRLGDNPQAVATTTPRPTKFIKELVAESGTRVTRGNTYENKANLAKSFITKILSKYEGTRLGRQELYAELLTDTPGALWKYEQLDALRLNKAPLLKRVVVGVDPAASAFEDSAGRRRDTSNEEPAETGIIVAALGYDEKVYVLDDLSLIGTPGEWGAQAVTAYHKHQSDRIVAEVNQGGDMVEYVIQTIDPNAAVKKVRAARSKTARAEPVSALYEKGRVHHVGMFKELEDQMCTWVQGDKSPDRIDALVWAITELCFENEATFFIG